MKEIKNVETKVIPNSKKEQRQLRTRVPAFIRDFMTLTGEDTLVWHAIIEGDNPYVILEKKEQEKND